MHNWKFQIVLLPAIGVGQIEKETNTRDSSIHYHKLQLDWGISHLLKSLGWSSPPFEVPLLKKCPSLIGLIIRFSGCASGNGRQRWHDRNCTLLLESQFCAMICTLWWVVPDETLAFPRNSSQSTIACACEDSKTLKVQLVFRHVPFQRWFWILSFCQYSC